MDPLIQIFLILWMLVLPILGITTPIIGLIFWYLVVPKPARDATWNRFRNISYHFVADDSGYAELQATKEEIPEGVVRTKKGWRFLPRPIFKTLKEIKKRTSRKKKEKSNNSNTTLEDAEEFVLRKFIWKGMGKPIWFDYAGKVTSMNPATLAALQQTNKSINLDIHFDEINTFLKDVPKHISKPLSQMLNNLEMYAKAVPITSIDPTKIKEVVPQMYTPSQLQAVATHSELLGMKKAGKQYGGLILGGALIIGMVIALIVVASFLLA